MGYTINALAAAGNVLEKPAREFRCAFLVKLEQNITLLPVINGLRDEVRDQIIASRQLAADASNDDVFDFWMGRLSTRGMVAQLWANYFGGYGSQGATVWENGEVILKRSDPMGGSSGDVSPISDALETLGVIASGACDAFDEVGLGAHRKTIGWAVQSITEAAEDHPKGPVYGLIASLNERHADEHLQSEIREAAANRLGQRRARGAIPALTLRARKDLDYGVRLSATTALGQIGEPALPEMIALLEDPTIEDKWPIAFTLSRLGPPAAPAVPGLMALLDDEDYRVRQQSAEALGGIGPKASEAVPKLLHLMTDAEWPVRSDVCRALAAIDVVDSAILQALRDRKSNDDERFVRDAATAALEILAQQKRADNADANER